MPLNLKKTIAALEGQVAIEDAETLLNWLLEHPKGKISLKKLDHAHSAVWQVLMACQPQVASFPEPTPEWMQSTFTNH